MYIVSHNLSTGDYSSEPFLLVTTCTWKRKRCGRVHKEKKTMKNAIKRPYGNDGTCTAAQTKCSKDDSLTFLVKELLIKQRYHGKHPIHVEWNIH